ncbi:hypothetical protein E1301_Tti018523 [Triplophysa tibetana]|uniref:Uncharacterized protein n=1 Tax=Triplophysa tibetana TaxID=1572043 RepID=A0A5A9MTS1_9TELE|nr:hypothetical protein E1301_Tti022678 [Triplophysa tibetana]KAA0701674.1 hypothetical protein E1301_Tti018523 [Triplophysa tibetana]
MASATRARVESFVWTDDEVELLLRVTLDYKSTKLKDNVDWESCHSKYSDIMDAFQAQYPRESTEKDFPHGANMLSKAQVTTKLKSIRCKYRQTVGKGRRSGQGRVVLIFYALCEEIWGGSPATRCIDAGIETTDLEESSTSTVELAADSPYSTESIDCLPSAVGKQRRDSLRVKLNSHRGDRPKRKILTDPAEEDLQIKRRMLELMEDSVRRNSDNMQQINTNIANLTSTIQDGFSLMRELLSQRHSGAEGGGNAQRHWMPITVKQEE